MEAFLCFIILGGNNILFSMTLLIGLGLVISLIFRKIKLPSLMGYLGLGFLLGPYGFNLFPAEFLIWSADIRKLALVIILIRAGLSINFKDIQRVGRPALCLSFLPATFEIILAGFLGPWLLGLPLVDAFLLGTIIAAVSPAIVVPRMIQMMDEGLGQKNRIPQIILAGASLDDIFVLVVFSAGVTLKQTGIFSWFSILSVPVSIILGILLGYLLGKIVSGIIDKYTLEPLYATVLIFVVSLVCIMVEDYSQHWVSGLLAIIMLNSVARISDPIQGEAYKASFNKAWFLAEMFLFTLVGCQLDLQQAFDFGWLPIVFIVLTSLWRMVGVYLSVSKTSLQMSERIFVMGAYLPKATVQAAIGSIPLALGFSTGYLILTVSILEILITAPIGAWWIDLTKDRLLDQDLS